LLRYVTTSLSDAIHAAVFISPCNKKRHDTGYNTVDSEFKLTEYKKCVTTSLDATVKPQLMTFAEDESGTTQQYELGQIGK
jgi:hypothetical protein